MAKTTRQGGASNAAAGAVVPRQELNLADTDGVIDGNLRITGNLVVDGTTTAGPAPSTEQNYTQIAADITSIVIDTLNLDAVTGINWTVPNVSVPTYLQAMMTVSHSVASANVIGGIGLSSATIVTQLLGATFTNLGVIGTKGTVFPLVRVPANTPGVYQLFICGDAGTAAVRAAAYFPSFLLSRSAG